MLQIAASRAAAKRREPSLHELNILFACEGMDAINESTHAAFLAWARAHDVAMDDESYCDFCADLMVHEGRSTRISSAGTADHTAHSSASTVHQLLDGSRRR